jgi:hypothetical protein
MQTAVNPAPRAYSHRTNGNLLFDFSINCLAAGGTYLFVKFFWSKHKQQNKNRRSGRQKGALVRGAF